MTSTWRLRYAPVVRIDEARIDIPGATKNYVPTALVGEVNPVLYLPSVGITVQPTRGGYLAVSYSIITPITDFTIVIPPDFDDFDTFVPCVSWIENTVLRRFRLTNVPVGEVPFPLYKGQLIDAASAVIELWARGDNDHLTIADWFLRVGLLEVPGRAEQLVGSTYITEPCIASVQGDPALFASYLISCARGGFVPPPPVVAAPVILPASGTYGGTITVTITCSTPGAFIYFRVNNTLPFSLYSGPFAVGTDLTVESYAILPGATDSPTVSANYVISAPATPYFIQWEMALASTIVMYSSRTSIQAGDYAMNSATAGVNFSGLWCVPAGSTTPNSFSWAPTLAGPFLPVVLDASKPGTHFDSNGFPYVFSFLGVNVRIYETLADKPQVWILRVT